MKTILLQGLFFFTKRTHCLLPVAKSTALALAEHAVIVFFSFFGGDAVNQMHHIGWGWLKYSVFMCVCLLDCRFDCVLRCLTLSAGLCERFSDSMCLLR